MNLNLADIKTDIEYLLDDEGQYTHNIISAKLRTVAEKFGRGAANDLITEFSLDTRFGIQPI